MIDCCGAVYASRGSEEGETLADIMSNIVASLAQMTGQQQQGAGPSGTRVLVDSLTYHPPGSESPLLRDVSMDMEANTLGLVYGCSGGGKSTLLHVLAGLSQESHGSIRFGSAQSSHLNPTLRMQHAGIVFQFPERHFLGDTLAEELTFAWPVGTPAAMAAQQVLTSRVHHVLASVGLSHIPFDTKLDKLSGGYKRRVALAVQLVRQPKLLLLDEPLAGLDWRARQDLVRVLGTLRRECTVLVVSHDLHEILPLVDRSWRMKRGGILVDSESG